MTILKRALEILTWRHVAWTLAIVVVWQSVARVGMVGNAVDRMTLGSWLYDVGVGLSSAAVYLAAVIVAEAASRAGSVPPLRSYIFAALAASAIILASRPLLPEYPRTYAGPEHRRAFERVVKLVSNPAGMRRQKLMDSAEHLVFFSLATFVYAGMRRSRLAWRALAEAELARSEAQRELIATRLGSAQTVADPAQVLERLVEIEAMYEGDRLRADAMMDELIAVLRDAIPRLRTELAEASTP